MASGFRMYSSQAPPQESRFRPQPPPSSGSRFFPSGTFKRAGGGGGTYRSSTLLHKGFYDLLSVLKPEPALDPLVSASPLAGPRYEDHPRPGSGPRSPTLPTPRGGVNTMPGSMPRGAVLAGGGGGGAVGGGERGTGGRGPNAAMLDCPLPPGFGGERIEFSSTASRSSPAAVKGEKKVISKDMIGRPTQFVHVLHASDADQAQEMLMRFAAEGVGKMPDENWAKTIKGIITARAKQRQALAIAEVQDAIHRESYDAYNGPLHVTNGLPSSAGYPSTIRSPLSTPTTEKTLSIMTQATIGHPSTVKQSSPLRGPNSPASSPLSSGAPPFPATALQRKPSPPKLLRADTAQTVVVRPLPEVPTTPTPTPASIPGMPGTSTAPSTPISKTNGEAPPAFPPRPIVPTMETLERAASAAIFFETLYHGLLKSAVSHQNPHQTRERRRRALERDLERRPDLTEAERREARERLRFEETAWLREKRKKVGVKEFSKVKVIGHGAFGVVSLVRERETNALYAMKQLRKGDMLRKGQEGHVRSERDLLAAAASEGTSDASWIVKLHYSFQDADHLYLVLDYMGGGDLLNLLVEKDIFPEDFTRFYIAEMVLSLEACHKLGYIHRDIKPDNFLIGPDGHLCVSDFGLATDLHWAHDTTYYEQQRRDLLKRHGIDLEEPSSVGGRAAKKLDRKTAEQIMGGEEGLLTWRDKNRKKLAYSVAGTNSYMAPEVIRGLGYGFSCDWWSLGVIMYECLYGYPPFVSQSRQATRQKILNWQSSLRFPPRPRVSREAIDLMTALLCEPSDRIGSNFEPQRPNSHIIQERRSGFLPPPAGALSGDGADQIKAHPWFKGIDFSTIHLERAPYQPEMRDPADTRHFDEDIPDEPLAPAGGGAPDATKDPVLKHRVHGAHVLDIRKQKAFAGFTYKAPRPISRGAIPTGLGGPSSSDELTEPSMLASSATQQQAVPAILSRPNVAPAATVAVGAAALSGTVRGRALSL